MGDTSDKDARLFFDLEDEAKRLAKSIAERTSKDPTDVPAGPEERVERYIALRRLREEVEAALKPVKAEIEVLEGKVIDDFAESGRQSVRQLGRTVYLSRDLTIRNVSGTASTVAALRRARLTDLIGINHPKFKAWAKERMTDQETGEWTADASKLPPTIRELVEVDEYAKLGFRKAT